VNRKFPLLKARMIVIYKVFLCFLINCLALKEISAASSILIRKNNTVDINIVTENDVKSIQVENFVFLLNGDQFYQLHHNKTQMYLVKMAKLETNTTNKIIMFDVVLYDNNILIVILARHDYFEVFEISTIISSDTKPIQKITTLGGFQGAKAIRQKNGEVIFITATYLSNVESMISIYKWSESYFRQTYKKYTQLIHEFSAVSNGNDIFAFYTKALKTKIILYLLKISNDYKVDQLDNIILKYGSFFTFTFENQIFINFSPLKKAKSTLFFINKSNQIFPSKEQPEKFNKGIATNNTFIGLIEGAINVYCNIELRCYGSISLRATKLFSFHYITLNKLEMEFLILHFKDKHENILRIIPVTRNNYVNKIIDTTHKSHFVEATKNLQRVILKVKQKVTTIKDQINLHRCKNITQSLKHMHLHNSVVGEVNLVSKNLLTSSNLWKKVELLQNDINLLKHQFTIKRSKRNIFGSKSLSVGHLKIINLIYNESLTVPFLHLNANITTKLIDVNNMNNVPWNHFVFGIASNTSIIKGALRFRSPVHVQNLKTRKLNNLNTNEIFNLVGEQNITSNIFINKGLFSSIINSTRLNKLHPDNDIAKINYNNIINSHVSIKKIQILNILKVSEKEEHLRHIFGTHFEDLQQIYTGRVSINGSLTLVNIEIDSDKLFLEGKLEAIDIDFYKDFWVTNLYQVIATYLNFGYEITCPGLNSKLINSKDISTYLQTSDESTNGVTYMVFNSTNIFGDVNILKEFQTNFSKLKLKAVGKLFIDTVKFGGVKKFHRLQASKILSQHLNDIKDREFIFKGNYLKNITFAGKKNMKLLTVQKSVNIMNGFYIDFINNRSLADAGLSYQKKFSVVSLDKPLISTDLIINTLNGEHFSNIMHFVDDDLNFNTTLVVAANVDFSRNLKVNKINTIQWNEYRNKIVEKNIFEVIDIHDRKSFKNIVEIEFVDRLIYINEINLRDLFENIMLKDRAQIVTTSWNFGNAKFVDINTTHLNHIQINDIIDRRGNAVINSNFYVEMGNINHNVKGDFEYDFDSLFQKVKFIDQQNFRVVRVLDHAKWSSIIGNETVIDYLNKYGVRKDAEQVITGKVVLVKPLINSAFTTKSIFKDFDFEYIAKDCLYKKSVETQYVTAKTIFTRPIQIDTVNAFRGLEASYINRMNIQQFNETAYRKNENVPTIKGFIKFNLPIIVDHLFLENGKLDGVSIANLYCFNSTKLVPPVSISDLHVINSLSTSIVIDYNFNDFFERRITKRRNNHDLTGHPSFLDLKVARNIQVKSLNKINVDDVIWKTTKKLQNIKGSKRIFGNLTMEGPSSINKLNERDFMEKAKASVLLKNNYNLQNLSSESIAILRGINLTRVFNDFNLKNISNSNKTEVIKRLYKIEDSLKSKSRNNFIQLTTYYKIFWNEDPPNICKAIGNFDMNNLSIIVKKDSIRKSLFLNYEDTLTLAETNENFNITISITKGGSILNLRWKIPNINEEFYKAVKLNLTDVILINAVEISDEFQAIVLKTKETYLLYRFDKFEHYYIFVGSFKDIRILNNKLFLKHGSSLLILGKSFEIIEQLDEMEISEVFSINSILNIVSFSKIHSTLMIWTIGKDDKPSLIQTISISITPLEIKMNSRHCAPNGISSRIHYRNKRTYMTGGEELD
ncbi:hypothetical protein ACFFRR_009735, partial [Megaselia abdita]